MAMLKIAVGCDPNAASAKAALMQYLGQISYLGRNDSVCGA